MSKIEKRYHFIYKTTNLKNGNFYIGMHSTDIINDGYLGSGNRLRRSIKRNGKENFSFEILEYFPDRITLAERENHIVNDDLLNDPKCMNLRVGGTGGFSHEQQLINSKRGCEKFLELMKNDEWRENRTKKIKKGLQIFFSENSSSFIGKKHREESKIKIGNANKLKSKGVNNSQYNTRWITNGIVNKKIKTFESLPDGWSFGRILKSYSSHSL
jgi:hypothetical protein